MIARLMNIRNVALVVGAMLIGSLAFGFAASNTFSDGGKDTGIATDAISGYDITNVAYTYNTAGTDITAVSFDVDGSPTAVKAHLNSDEFVSCVAGTAPSWSCTLGAPVPVDDAVSLTVFVEGAGTPAE